MGDVIVAPDQYERGVQIMERLRQGETWSGEFLIRRRDDTELPVLVTDSPIRDADGGLVGISASPWISANANKLSATGSPSASWRQSSRRSRVW